MSHSVIIVAGGQGSRLGHATAKAFVAVGGVPMFVHSLRTFASSPGIGSIVLVAPGEYVGRAVEIVGSLGVLPVPVEVTAGGAERQDSVGCGLARLGADVDVVLVHDAARPFVSPACVRACVAAIQPGVDGALAALPASDTVKLAGDDGTIRETVDRRRVWLAQTPQVFRVEVLKRAYEQASRDGIVATDEAALVERIGGRVMLVPGEAANRKITTPADLQWAEWHLNSRASASKTGAPE